MGTSSVTTMDGMFYYAHAFNQTLSFDTSSVTTMEKMFYNARAFNRPLNFNTSSVTTMEKMFNRAHVYQQREQESSGRADFVAMKSSFFVYNGSILGLKYFRTLAC